MVLYVWALYGMVLCGMLLYICMRTYIYIHMCNCMLLQFAVLSMHCIVCVCMTWYNRVLYYMCCIVRCGIVVDVYPYVWPCMFIYGIVRYCVGLEYIVVYTDVVMVVYCVGVC